MSAAPAAPGAGPDRGADPAAPPRRGGWRAEARFLGASWRMGLQAAMAFRGAFVLQVLGMLLNNAMYFAFWVILFARFPTIGDWTLPDVVLLFGVVAGAFGLSVVLFGNVTRLTDIVVGGGLDAHLALPRPVLLGVLSSRMMVSGLGDILTALICFVVAGRGAPWEIVRFVAAVGASAAIFLGFMVLTQSLSFWIGGATLIRQATFNAFITFASYPLTLFDGTAKLFLLTILPAGVMGTLSADFVRRFSWLGLGRLVAAAVLLVGAGALVFRAGLRRYESGSLVAGLD